MLYPPLLLRSFFSPLSRLFNDTSKTAKTIWFLLFLHWAVDVKLCDFYYIHGSTEDWRNQMIFAVLDVSLNKRP